MADKQTVWVAVYEHKYGEDIRVFKTEAQALLWQRQIATEWWDDEFPGKDLPSYDVIGDEYFESACNRGEYFSMQQAVVEGD